MSSAQVIRLRSGESITMRSGVLRGAGPQGPMGPPGPRGNPGDQGPPGPMGELNDLRTDLTGSGTVATSDDHWYPVSIALGAQNDLLVDSVGQPYDGLAWRPIETGVYLIAGQVTFNEITVGGTSVGARRVRIVDQAGTAALTVELEAVSNGKTTVPFARIAELNPAFTYHLEAQSSDTGGINVSARAITLMRIGAGPMGPPGPPGPVGDDGPQGPQGDPGDASTGYTAYDGLTADGNSEVAAAPADATDDQQLPIPGGSQEPAVPAHLKVLAEAVERQLIAIYASGADQTSRRPTLGQGEIFHLLDLGAWYAREKNGTNAWVARVIASTSAPPSGPGQASRGMLWIQAI